MLTVTPFNAIKFGAILVLLISLSSCQNDEKREQTATPGTQKSSIKSEHKELGPKLANSHIKLRYFYSNTHRCGSCRTIEAYTKKAILENFSDEIKSGKIEFTLVDMDSEENKSLIKQYKLFTKSVVLSEHANGNEIQWSNLDKVWTLLNNETAFISYVVKEVKGYLNT